MNRCLAGVLALVAAVLAAGVLCAQEDMRVVDNDAFRAPQRPPSVFVHEAHNEAAEIWDCNVCHHVYEDGRLLADESSEDLRCSDCHSEEGGDGQPALMEAFHRQCKGCHERQGKGPVMCGECHRR